MAETERSGMTLWIAQDSAKRTVLASRNFGDLDPDLQQTITELLENSARATDANALQKAADLQKYAEDCLNVLSNLQSHDVTKSVGKISSEAPEPRSLEPIILVKSASEIAEFQQQLREPRAKVKLRLCQRQSLSVPV